MERPDPKRSRRHARIARVVLGLLVVLVLYGVAHLRPVIFIAWRLSRGTSFEWAVMNWQLRCHGQPVERELAAGRIRPGDSADELVARMPPGRAERYGPYQILFYFPAGSIGGGPLIMVKDGRVTSALSSDCTWSHLFFDTLTPAEGKEAGGLYEAARTAKLAAEVMPRMMIVGGIGVIDPWNFPADPEPAN